MVGFTKEKLQEIWAESKDLETLFNLWRLAFPCPYCKRPTLDFMAPSFNFPFICRTCHKHFDFKEVSN